jgi:SagB-type dehydrogenase family enzyme
MHTLTKLFASAMGQLKPARAKSRASKTIALPAPSREGGLPLFEALSKRHSGRDFTPAELPEPVLSQLLWAAFGVNRPETKGRTAPSALNAQEVDIYLARADGLYLYEAETHALGLVAEVDARRVTGYQDFVDEAALDLIYVADHAHLHAVPADQRLVYSAATVGAIAQNVYLYAASAGLETVVRGWFDRAAVAGALALGPNEHVLLTQTVGYGKAAPSAP